MPYDLAERDGRTCVVDENGEPVAGGCHDEHDEAVAHLRALMANVPDAKRAAMSDAFPLDPPDEWFFEQPSWFVPGMKLTVITEGPEAGRVAGSVAARGTFILSGRGDQWTSPPSPSAYKEAMQGDTWTTAGRYVRTANLACDIDHVDARASFRQARDAMANTGTQLARVRYYDVDGHTIALGAAWPGLSDLQIRKMQASALSGHWAWREEYGGYDMAGSIFVNAPGLPLPDRPIFQPRLAIAASLDCPHPPIYGDWIPESEAPMGAGLTLTLSAEDAVLFQEIMAERRAARTAAAPPPAAAMPAEPAMAEGAVSREEFDALAAQVSQIEQVVAEQAMREVDELAVTAAMPEPVGA